MIKKHNTFCVPQNTTYNNFLNTFLRIFNASFPPKKNNIKAEYQSLNNNWDENIM